MSSATFAKVNSEPRGIEDHLKFESRTKKYLKKLTSDAGEMGQKKVGMLHSIMAFKYDPATSGTTHSDHAVFVGHYQF